jgi:glutamate/tyrosine decarboxylase-like PLP-dependent enzyme
MDISKLSRKQITELLDQVPHANVLGSDVSRELTPQQKKFALEVAKGARGAEAYRRAYNNKGGKKKTQGDGASRLKKHPGVAAEIEAYKVALAAQEYRTPAALRSLVIQTLTQTLIDADTPPAVRVQAARVLGTVTEVAAFTERKEIRGVAQPGGSYS